MLTIVVIGWGKGILKIFSFQLMDKDLPNNSTEMKDRETGRLDITEEKY